MSERLYEAKISKTIIILLLSFSPTGLGVFGLGMVIPIIELCKMETNIKLENILLPLITLITCFLFCFAILLVVIFYVYQYKTYTYEFFEEKMCEKNGRGKVNFEIEYKNIIEVRRGLITTSILCKEPFRKTGWNKGATAFVGYYNKRDFHYIRQIIVDKNPNVVFS